MQFMFALMVILFFLFVFVTSLIDNNSINIDSSYHALQCKVSYNC